MANHIDRRWFLSLAGGTVASIAGCAELEGDGDGSEPETGATTTGEPDTNVEGRVEDSTTDTNTTNGETAPAKTADETESPSGTMTTETDEELDLREANVVEVAFDRQNGTVEFAVTLYHDDDGEAEYANWWQVETLDGDRLGRRELAHAHSTAPFTRSEAIDVPNDVACVFIRGHDQIHDYGGQGALINVESGETNLVRQGSDRQSFDASDCP
ncbi:MAG: hypothetical protein ACI9PP_001580 [Halobacteriales archaeon]|jgi:hypothetical protein